MGIKFPDSVIQIDIESHSVTELQETDPYDFFRLGQWSWGEDTEIHTTTDLDEFRRQVLKAKMIVGHNIIAFDLIGIFGSPMPGVKLAKQHRLYDTMVAATLANPAPFGEYVKRDGTKAFCRKPEEFRPWYSLDNQAFQLGLPGKLPDLKQLAEEYSYRWEPQYSAKTGKKLKADKKVPIEGICCGFGAIPTDNERFVEYAKQDIRVTREVARRLLEKHPFNDYMKWEMEKVALATQIGRGNGFRVDVPATLQREKDQHEEAAWILKDLNDRFGFPLDGKAPLASKLGKEATINALSVVGVWEEALGKTKPSDSHPEGQTSFSGDNIMAATHHVQDAKGNWQRTDDGNPEAQALGEALALLAGQRSLPTLLLSTVYKDGKVHPEIFPYQRSARFSTTNPGLTIWDERYKDLLVAEPGCALVEFDFDNADGRAVAAASGDPEYAKRFLPGVDGHAINAVLIWGQEAYDASPGLLRQGAKAPGHGINYNMGVGKMVETTGISRSAAQAFKKNFYNLYKGVKSWQDRIIEFSKRTGYIVTDWGRKMPIEPKRWWTQTPAAIGQNATHEILMMGVSAVDERRLRQIVLTVHDAFLASIPLDTLEEDIKYFQEKFTRTWHPKGGQPIEFSLSNGPPGDNWKTCAH